jgi:hypothetical protein
MLRTDYLEDLSINGRIILKCISRAIGCEDVNWI